MDGACKHVLDKTPESLGVNSLWSGRGVFGAVSNPRPALELDLEQARFLGVAKGVAVQLDKVPGAVLPIIFI